MLYPIHESKGADPEGFLTVNGSVIGSEKAIPKEGLKPPYYNRPLVIQDGVQFELNPGIGYSARDLFHAIGRSLNVLHSHLGQYPEVKIHWGTLIEVDQAELDSLSDSTRILGCQPSFNIYEDRPITVNAKTYRKRSAGGHMHLGLPRDLMNRRKAIIACHDIFVGNTAVMLDRDPGAAERRENYGRAGEYRTPNYGVEYRTPSNFWLRNPSIASLLYSLSDMAVATVHYNMVDELSKLVDIDKIIEAINTNNFELAKANFQRIRPFIAAKAAAAFELVGSNLDRFELFADTINAKGLESFFPDDPLVAWNGNYNDFRSVLATVF